MVLQGKAIFYIGDEQKTAPLEVLLGGCQPKAGGSSW
jgi:hypothetical protein